MRISEEGMNFKGELAGVIDKYSSKISIKEFASILLEFTDLIHSSMRIKKMDKYNLVFEIIRWFGVIGCLGSAFLNGYLATKNFKERVFLAQ